MSIPTSLYLDTSDLSTLLLGRQGGRSLENERARLLELLASGAARLRISFLHLAEMALRPELRPLAETALVTTPGIYFLVTAPHDVFTQEGQGLVPDIFEWPLTTAMLSPTGLELGRFVVPWRWVAYAARGGAFWWTAAARLGNRARRGETPPTVSGAGCSEKSWPVNSSPCRGGCAPSHARSTHCSIESARASAWIARR